MATAEGLSLNALLETYQATSCLNEIQDINSGSFGVKQALLWVKGKSQILFIKVNTITI